LPAGKGKGKAKNPDSNFNLKPGTRAQRIITQWR